MSKRVIIEKNCVRTQHVLFSYFVSVLDFYFAIGKDQAGKSHNYPSHRKPYSSGRKRSKEKIYSATTSNTLTYFDMQLQKQREKGRLKSSSLY